MSRLLLLLAIVSVLPAWAAPLIPRFAYVPNSQDDTISIFALRQSGLRAIGYVYAGAGSNPRAAAVTPERGVGRTSTLRTSPPLNSLLASDLWPLTSDPAIWLISRNMAEISHAKLRNLFQHPGSNK